MGCGRLTGREAQEASPVSQEIQGCVIRDQYVIRDQGKTRPPSGLAGQSLLERRVLEGRGHGLEEPLICTCIAV